MNEIQGAFYILHGGDFRQMIGLPKCMEEIHRLIHFLHQMIKLLRCQGLGAITEGFFRIVVDLDHETVSSGCDRCHSERLDHETDPGCVARVDDDRKVSFLL